MPGPQTKPMAKPKNTFGTLKRIFGYMKEFRLRLIIVFIGIIFSSAASVAGTYMLKPVIDNYIQPFINKDNPDLSGLIRILCVMGIIYLTGAVSTWVFNRTMTGISTKTLYKIRVDLFRRLESLPIKYFDTHSHGEIMSRFTNDSDAVREMLTNSIAQFISSGITVVSVFCMMLILSWQLTIIVILMFFVIIFVIKKIGGKSGNHFKEQQKAIGAVNGYIEEMIEGQKVVKVFCHEKESKESFEKINEALRQASTNANTFANILMPIMNNLSYIHYALTAIAGGIIAVLGYITFGAAAVFLQYTRQFAQPITQISQQFNSVLSALAGAERIFAIIDESPEADEGYVTLVKAERNPDGSLSETDPKSGIWAWKHPHHDGTVTYTEVRGKVTFDDVVFGYNENKTVLNGITLYAKPGQKIAFVGSTGAGKTTITNLINRFYDVPDGKIRYDDININKIRKSDLRRSQSVVLQDTHLFTGTIMDNIRYGRLDATDEEVIAAAKLANADSFIRHLTNGYNTVITGDGGSLSQGQRQLLAIARASVAGPPVLILDEATSSIDTRTERLIEKGMDRLMDGRTVFVIAHRLSTVRNSHAIMVMEQGRIIERGSHDDLIAKRGRYYQLYTGMFELS
ncbi:MAG: ABC transporter ATP-binding protein [Porcipelethomonas sp.]